MWGDIPCLTKSCFAMPKHPPKGARLLLVAPLAFLLAGCFSSEQPKFPLASAAAPFGEGGRYVVYEHVADNRYQRQEVFVIKRRADRAYDFVNEKGEVLTISLHEGGSHLFAGQAKAEQDKDKPGYGYVMFRIAGGEAVLHAPQCDQQDRVMLEAFGVEISSAYDCIIDRVADPVGLFKRLDLGQPVSKLVRE
jgi:hypothetical protein